MTSTSVCVGYEAEAELGESVVNVQARRLVGRTTAKVSSVMSVDTVNKKVAGCGPQGEGRVHVLPPSYLTVSREGKGSCTCCSKAS